MVASAASLFHPTLPCVMLRITAFHGIQNGPWGRVRTILRHDMNSRRRRFFPNGFELFHEGNWCRGYAVGAVSIHVFRMQLQVLDILASHGRCIKNNISPVRDIDNQVLDWMEDRGETLLSRAAFRGTRKVMWIHVAGDIIALAHRFVWRFVSKKRRPFPPLLDQHTSRVRNDPNAKQSF
jgi:hypothetical protein